MADRLPNRPPRTNWGNLSKNLALWLLVGLLALALFQMMSRQRNPTQEFSYTEFSKQLDQGNVARVEVFDGKRLEGDFRSPVTQDGRSAKSFQVLLPVANSEVFIKRLEDANVPILAKEPKGGITAIIIAALPWIVILGLWFFLLRQLQAGGSRAFAFGKSKAKLLAGDTPKVTFADVAGADEAKVELQEIIEFLKDPQKFTRLGGRLPKGALLVGPPGTGKTLLAKAVAGEAGRPFFSMSGSDFVEMFVGVGASRVRDLFEQGKSHAPCIIFIDEIDAVGRHRGAGLGGGHDEREQTLNQLLVEMDGFESNDGVILVAATNRPDVLDPALLRPGRFDRQIVVDAPDVRGREGILRVHTRKIPLASDVRLEVIAKGTPGMAGADLANLVNEAAVLAARRNKTLVDMQDFEDAKDKVMLGVERRSLVLTEDERRLTAYHEAGHAIVAIKIPGSDPVHKVTIVPRGRALGLTASLPEVDRHNYSKDWLIGSLAMFFGGRVAEEIVFGPDKVTTGAGNDIERATGLARRMVTQFGMSELIGPLAVGDKEQEIFLGREFAQRREISERTAQMVDDEVKRLVDEAYSRASAILSENRELLDRIAQALLDRETIDREDLERLVKNQPLPPRSLPPAEPAAATANPASKSGATPARAPILGAPPAEPAARVNVTPLALHSPNAMREALRSHGWDEGLADNAAGGIQPTAFHLTGLDQGAIEALVPFAGNLGLEVLTGDSWAILAGSRSRLSALARPWSVPESLVELAQGIGLAMPGEPAARWQTARGSLALDRPVLAGILNVTPDSFSDGGQFLGVEAALAHTEELLRDGATIIDVGGESTRPDRTVDVTAEEELRRVVPVIEALARAYPTLLISIDTVKAHVARAALDAGAAIVNDVSALRLDPRMATTVAAAGAGIILMHSRGSILEIASYTHADYAGDVVGGVLTELRDALARAGAAGIGPEATAVDPGFGFSKTIEQNLVLLDQLGTLQALGRPIMVGPSRKRFLGSITGRPVEDRDRATAAVCALAYERGARLFRIHAVAATRETLAVAQAIGGGS